MLVNLGMLSLSIASYTCKISCPRPMWDGKSRSRIQISWVDVEPNHVDKAEVISDSKCRNVNFVPKNRHAVRVLSCFCVVIHHYVLSHLSELHNKYPPVQQLWMIWLNKSFKYVKKVLYNHNKTKQNKTGCIFHGMYCSWPARMTTFCKHAQLRSNKSELKVHQQQTLRTAKSLI